MRDELLTIFARIRATVCDTYSASTGTTRQGRITEKDLNRLVEMSGVEVAPGYSPAPETQEPATEEVKEPAPEPATEEVKEPAPEPATEEVKEPAPEPATEEVKEPEPAPRKRRH
jgi:outer membrane biosynthesis protein TonB